MRRDFVDGTMVAVVASLCFFVGAKGTTAEELPAMPPIPKLDQVAPESGTGYEKITLTEAVRRALARNPTAP